MTIFQAVNGRLNPVAETTYAEAGYRERADLQKLLKQQIEVIEPDLLIIAEEFGDWEGSRRRIDLLGIDKEANLVVVELKRTEDGGHMELQALRYAAMVSALTFDETVETFEQYLSANGDESDARSRLLSFLDCEQEELAEFPKDVRLILASAEFSKEITTTALWLNDHGLDIKCVRLRPYKDADRLLIDIQQVIPLPEAESYQIRIRDKKVAARSQSRDFTKFDVTVRGQLFESQPKRQAIFRIIKSLCDAGVTPEAVLQAIPWRMTAMIALEGKLKAPDFTVALAAKLAEQGRKPDIHRYFIEDDELIYGIDKTYAVTKMWGFHTPRAMDDLLQRFPDHDIQYRVSG